MTPHFDAVIVGSGFGGSVMAYRLADAGRSVCVLERGKAHPPGEFPRTLRGVRSNFWDPSSGLYGMYNVWFFRKLGALVSSGLGGGSLIYANVLLRKDPKWFVTEDFLNGGYRDWPISRQTLEPHYDAVKRMMQPVPFPDFGTYASVEKVRAFRAAAGRLVSPTNGLKVEIPDIAITFQNGQNEPGTGQVLTGLQANYHGVERRTCNLCGECVAGCNTGSKNTLDLTYLSEAQRATEPAEIRTLHEVTSFQPLTRNKIEVEYVIHKIPEPGEPPIPTRDLPVYKMTCTRLILAAGTQGSTFLMLKNSGKFGVDPEHVGSRFSGNGDLLSFVLNSTRTDDNEARVPYHLDPTRGPTITTALHQTESPGFYIEDAGFPKELAWLLEGFDLGGWFTRGLRFLRELWRKSIGSDPDTDLGKELSDLLGDANLSSRTMPLLAMGMDVPDGRFHLNGDDRLQLDWSRRGSAEYFARVEATARQLATELGGKFLRHIPTYAFGRAVTVHPLGGCPMGTSDAEGVVNSFGKVFTHDALYVIDGSIMPGPVGPNPAFTIAAVADRAATEMIETWPAD